MFVLGDAESAVEMKCCNNLENYPRGIVLLKHLSTMSLLEHGFSTPMAAGSYHMDSELNNDEIAFFPGHLDKPFVHTAWFVPLGTSSFFTIIAVAESWGQEQDLESLQSFQEWRGRLSTQDIKKVEDFLCEFDAQARRHIGNDNSVRLVYLNKPGSVLSFPANRCYHSTITPRKPTGYPRDMIVFHPLDGVS